MPNIFAILALCFAALILTSAKPSPNERIVNGSVAAKNQFPYLVSIRQDEVHWCGGSIISSRYVLTAAHCVGYYDEKDKYILNDVKDYTIRAGSNELLSGGVIVKVAEFFAHENASDIYQDIATIRLETALVFSTSLKAIALDANEVPAGTTLTVAGWGRIATNGDLSAKLLFATVRVMSRKECYSITGLDSASIYCLAHPVNNGACNGDSGGPAVVGGKLVAVAGFVFGGSCGTQYPDGYTKVSSYLDWIKKHSNV